MMRYLCYYEFNNLFIFGGVFVIIVAFIGKRLLSASAQNKDSNNLVL